MSPLIRRILLATDLSPASAAADAQAIDLARDLRAELLIVNVVDRSKNGGMVRSPDNLDRLPSDRETKARDLAAQARAAGIPSTFLIWEGDPGQSIVDAAASEGVDLVIVGRRERGRVGRLLLGSVSQHVVANARCPVLVARP